MPESEAGAHASVPQVLHPTTAEGKDAGVWDTTASTQPAVSGPSTGTGAGAKTATDAVTHGDLACTSRLPALPRPIGNRLWTTGGETSPLWTAHPRPGALANLRMALAPCLSFEESYPPEAAAFFRPPSSSLRAIPLTPTTLPSSGPRPTTTQHAPVATKKALEALDVPVRATTSITYSSVALSPPNVKLSRRHLLPCIHLRSRRWREEIMPVPPRHPNTSTPLPPTGPP